MIHHHHVDEPESSSQSCSFRLRSYHDPLDLCSFSLRWHSAASSRWSDPAPGDEAFGSLPTSCSTGAASCRLWSLMERMEAGIRHLGSMRHRSVMWGWGRWSVRICLVIFLTLHIPQRSCCSSSACEHFGLTYVIHFLQILADNLLFRSTVW